MSINRIGSYFKGKRLPNGAEMAEKFDNFNIELDNVGINAISRINDDGFYWDILAVYKNNRIYRGQRFHTKYIATVRDTIFEYYEKNGQVPWLK